MSRTAAHAALDALDEAIRRGPPEVIGYDAKGPRQEGFNFGWNENANRLWEAATRARRALNIPRGKQEHQQ